MFLSIILCMYFVIHFLFHYEVSTYLPAQVQLIHYLSIININEKCKKPITLII